MTQVTLIKLDKNYKGVTTLEEALDPDNAYHNLADTAYQVFRLIGR